MSRTAKRIWTILLVNLLAIVALYIVLAFYYMEGFPCCTWINGVYCTGKSVEEVNQELCAKVQYDGLKVIDITGAELYLRGEDVGFKADYTDALNKFIQSRNPFLWGLNIFQNLVENIEPTVDVDRNALVQKISDWEIFMDVDDRSVSIVKTADSGYVLKDELQKVPNMDNIINTVYSAMLGFSKEVVLANYETSYRQETYDDVEAATVKLFDKIEKLQNCKIVYLIGDEKIPVGRSVVADWILTENDLNEARQEKVSKKKPGQGMFIIAHAESSLPDDEELSVQDGFVVNSNGDVVISQSKMYEFLSEMSNQHGTAWTMSRYRDGEDNEVIISDSSKGNGSIFKINDEFESLKNAFIQESYAEACEKELQLSDDVLIYNAKEDIGTTYIEVNMGDQLLSYYVDGELNMQMPIVTGNVNRSRGTPTGVFPVYNKRYHTYLRGVDYVSYVNYWLGVYKGVGIHDATWRSEFGEDIYQRDGSHGCINCPIESVAKLWDVVEIGTPVVLYY